MKLPSKTLERKLFKNGYSQIVGVDEVGVGCLAGPVVACAVMFDSKFFNKNHRKLNWLRESKLLSSHQREAYAKELLKIENLKFKICYASPKTIDKINIYHATRLAMRRAVSKLVHSSQLVVGSRKLQTKNNKLRTITLVDGNTKIKGLTLPQQAIVKGDRKVFAIACASIIAKVARDKMMLNYSKKYPGYGFEKHKGYATSLHKAMLAQHGICPIHRRSFAPVAKLL